MQDNHASNHERHQIVQREEPVQRWVINRKAAPEERHDALTNDRNRREKVGDHGGTPEAHLAPWQDVAHEGCRHHQQEDHHTKDPQQFTRRLVRAVIKASGKCEDKPQPKKKLAVFMWI